MPPLLARRPVRPLKQCRRCSRPPLNRTFSSSPPCQAIGPESPRFIEVPHSRQAHANPRKDIKGTLPPPRKIFPQHAADQKIAPEYLSNTAPKAQTNSSPRTEFDAWKTRMADQRRSNLREGLAELHARKVKREAHMSGISAMKNKQRYQLLHAPRPEHERLTAESRSTFELQGLPKGPIPDPNRAERVAQKMARTQAMADAKAEQRRTALHELYMHARYFITTEQQLEEMVEQEFHDKMLARLGGNRVNQNLWDAYGPPETVADKMNVLNTTQRGLVDDRGKAAALAGERMQRLAEELTGGKMDRRVVS